MTIGKRIAQIRKEKGLSQEAFGESLGVTRQSISKWESDISIPEVDKLLAMSKLYEVSVGWLLGEELEKTNENQELTEEQWEMVGKITEKYIASMPQPRVEPKKWYKIVAIALVCIVFVGYISLFHSVYVLKDNLAGLQNDLLVYQREVTNKLANIITTTDEVELIGEEEQESILKEHSALSEVDIATETITYHVSAIPKTYVSGMWAEFVFSNDGEMYTVESVEVDEMNRFNAICQMPYSDNIRIFVVLHVDDEEQMQEIYFSDNQESMSRVKVFDDTRDAVRGNVMEYDETKELKITLYNDFISNTASAKAVQWKFYKNEELIQTLDGVLGEEKEYVEPVGVHIATGVLPNTKIATTELDHEILNSFEKGDSLWVVVIVTDNFDREYVVDIDTYRVSDEMIFEIEDVSLEYENPKWFE